MTPSPTLDSAPLTPEEAACLERLAALTDRPKSPSRQPAANAAYQRAYRQRHPERARAAKRAWYQRRTERRRTGEGR